MVKKKVVKRKKKVDKRKFNFPSPQTIAASQSNRWWELRSKHGRDKLFASPDLMLEAAKEYFKWCDDNPEYEYKPMVVSIGGNAGSSVEMVKVPKKQPYSLMGLCLYLGVSSAYFRQFKLEQKDKPENRDFLSVITIIEQAIYKQQYDGAASGFFNANIISRALGLVEKVEAEVTDNRKSVSDLFPVSLNKPNE